MKLSNRIILLTAIIAMFGVVAAFGQRGPRASQMSNVDQKIGATQIKVTYSRPNQKGRTLWGAEGLVPNGKVWRTGANEATVFETSADVMIEGKKLPAGKYSLYTIPGDKEWTIIFNSTWKQWGTRYNKDTDVLRVNVTPKMATESIETMSIGFAKVMADSAYVVIGWGKGRIPFKVSTMPAEKAAN